MKTVHIAIEVTESIPDEAVKHVVETALARTDLKVVDISVFTPTLKQIASGWNKALKALEVKTR